MNNPGIRNLGDVALAAINAATASTVVTSSTDSSGNTIAYVDKLEGMLACNLQANFNYGSSGGTSIKVVFETSLDQGVTWLEVARVAFATSSEENVVNLSGLTPKTTILTPGVLSDDTAVDGILGDRFRARIITVGTYVDRKSVV